MTGVLGAALPLAPMLCGLSGLLLPVRNRRGAAWLGIAGSAVAVLLAIVLALTVHGLVETSHRIADFGGLAVTAGVRLDPAACYVAVAVGLVALAVQVYSTAYLADDDRYAPYAAQVSLFTAAMLLVVVSGDLVVMLVGWEVMGICSYLLIGHDRRLPEAPAAAVKAFLVTRVGDIGFLLGIAVLGVRAGSFRISDVLAHGVLTPATTTVACLLLLAGVLGKSAQFPLHTWLPDAMAGPTPISALIHAATMVAAGVYVVTRLYPLFLASPTALNVLAGIAVVTMLLGALAATTQDDIKRVLAWSTVSQIAYMVGALAVGSPAAALFHLLTHAAFKALLFLAAGSVIHAVGSNLMSRMGGLRHGHAGHLLVHDDRPRRAGRPSPAGRILEQGRHPCRRLSTVRAGAMCSSTSPAWSPSSSRPDTRPDCGCARSSVRPVPRQPGMPTNHRGPWPGRCSRWPYPRVCWALPRCRRRLPTISGPSISAWNPTAVITVVWAGLGGLFVWWLWRRRDDPAGVLGPLGPVFANGFYLDQVQDLLVARPVRALGRFARRMDESGVDGVVEGTGRAAVRLAGLVASAHRAALPRALTGVLAGAVLVSLAAIVITGVVSGVWP